MPIFDFKCYDCGNIVEKIVKSDQQEVPCPNCKGTMSRMISAPARIQFNGSGFYETDFKHK